MELKQPLAWQCRKTLLQQASHIYYQLTDGTFNLDEAACGFRTTSANRGARDPGAPTCPKCREDLAAKRAQGL